MNKMEIIENQEDAIDADYMVCVRLTQPLILPDNVIDLCCKCGEALQHRPHAPKGVKLVCEPCVLPDLERDAQRGELEVSITPDTARELAAYFRRKNAN